MTTGADPASTVAARSRRVLLTIVAVGLLGATAFGLWHLVVGGLINGNAKAGIFGVALALAAGLPLLAVVWFGRRRRPRLA